MNAGVLFDQLDLVTLRLEARLPGLGFRSRFQLRRAVAAAHIGKIGGDLGFDVTGKVGIKASGAVVIEAPV